MTPEEQAIADLVRDYGLQKCKTLECPKPPCVPRPDVIALSHSTLDAVTWECECGWKRTVPASWGRRRGMKS